MNPLSFLSASFIRASNSHLSGSDQLTLLHLFLLFNSDFWPDSVVIKDSEMMRRLRLYDSTGKPMSQRTLQTIRSRLKLKGFIDFRREGNEGIRYWLLGREEPLRTPLQTPLQTPLRTDGVAMERAREDIKTVDRRLTPTATTAGARDEVEQAWFENRGEYPKGGVAVALADAKKIYGAKAVCDAINQAALYDSRGAISYALVRRFLERSVKKDGQSTKPTQRADVTGSWGSNRRPPS